MKRVKVNAYQAGLVFKNGEYQRLLMAGTYWFWKNEEVYIYDITKPFVAPVELNILLQDKAPGRHPACGGSKRQRDRIAIREWFAETGIDCRSLYFLEICHAV